MNNTKVNRRTDAKDVAKFRIEGEDLQGGRWLLTHPVKRLDSIFSPVTYAVAGHCHLQPLFWLC